MAHAKICYHLGSPDKRDGIIEFFYRPIAESGGTLLVKSAADIGIFLELQEKFPDSPRMGVFRYPSPPGLPDDVPNPSNGTAVEEAGRMFDAWNQPLHGGPSLLQRLETVRDWVYLEPTNEFGVDTPEQAKYLSDYCLELIRLFQGWKLALPGFNAGQPRVGISGEPNHWDAELLPLLIQVAQSGGKHALSFHEAKLGEDDAYLDPIPGFVPHLIGRFAACFEAADRHGLARPDVIISELAWSFNDAPPYDQLVAEIKEFSHYYNRWPEVKMVVLWTLLTGDQWGALPGKMHATMQEIGQWVATTQLPEPDPAPEPDPPEIPPIKSTYILTPPYDRLTPQERSQLIDLAANGVPLEDGKTAGEHPVMPSHIDFLRFVALGLDGTKGIVLWGDRIGTGLTPEWIGENYPSVLPRLEWYTPGDPPPPDDFALTFWPTVEKRITQWFGANPENYIEYGLNGHEGIDLAAPLGTGIYAAAPGTVLYAGPNRSDGQPSLYGYHVYVDHGRYTTCYAHLAPDLFVTSGQYVRAGEVIGTSGNTGRSTGPHLHFGILDSLSVIPGYQGRYGSFVDPWTWLEHLYNEPSPPPDPDPEPPVPAILPRVGLHGEDGGLWAIGRGMTNVSVLHHISIGTTDNPAYDASRFGSLPFYLRVNYGYNPNGTLPPLEHEDDFVDSVIELMQLSRGGVDAFFVGNEPNNPHEFPNGQPITPEQYARVYNAIWARKPAGVQMGPAPMDPYFGPNSDNRVWWTTMLDLIAGLDMLFVHAKTQYSDPATIASTVKFSHEPLTWQFLHFRAFETLLDAVPGKISRETPVVMSEANPQRKPDGSLGWGEATAAEWVRRALEYVTAYNQRGGFQIHDVVFYRFSGDAWRIPQAALDEIDRLSR